MTEMLGPLTRGPAAMSRRSRLQSGGISERNELSLAPPNSPGEMELKNKVQKKGDLARNRVDGDRRKNFEATCRVRNLRTGIFNKWFGVEWYSRRTKYDSKVPTLTESMKHLETRWKKSSLLICKIEDATGKKAHKSALGSRAGWGINNQSNLTRKKGGTCREVRAKHKANFMQTSESRANGDHPGRATERKLNTEDHLEDEIWWRLLEKKREYLEAD
ncbi:hypothetical protein B0H13DRAFT_1900577 [Mycena leptocephala]|nr:hypothetical protein B0H13DRAFT_1900577 [Mycena leptocephala]